MFKRIQIYQPRRYPQWCVPNRRRIVVYRRNQMHFFSGRLFNMTNDIEDWPGTTLSRSCTVEYSPRLARTSYSFFYWDGDFEESTQGPRTCGRLLTSLRQLRQLARVMRSWLFGDCRPKRIFLRSASSLMHVHACVCVCSKCALNTMQ